jgi:hypothetical protein
MSPAQNLHSKSTGPRTPEGKKTSSLNALRHGLTGRVVVMPHEDLNAYQAFCKELIADLAPETPVESQYAQAFCDTQWRLNRALSIEDSMIALGHYEAAGETDAGHPEIHAAFTAARVFRGDSKAFVNLSLYEQRLQRTLKESLRKLQELQANRSAARQLELDGAVARGNLLTMKGQACEADTDSVPAGGNARFVCSSVEIDDTAQLGRNVISHFPQGHSNFTDAHDAVARNR